jgi:ATP-dependent DNA ligase
MNFRYPDKPTDSTPEAVARLPRDLYVAQAKADGFNLVVDYDGGIVRCLTRSNRPMEHESPKFTKEFVDCLSAIQVPDKTVINAEFVGPRFNFTPCVYIFNMLAWDGQWLTQEPYEQRWARCTGLSLPDGPVKLAECLEGDFIASLERLRANWKSNKHGCIYEGVVLKHRKGLMDLDLRNNAKSRCDFKLKFRENQREINIIRP